MARSRCGRSDSYLFHHRENYSIFESKLGCSWRPEPRERGISYNNKIFCNLHNLQEVVRCVVKHHIGVVRVACLVLLRCLPCGRSRSWIRCRWFQVRIHRYSCQVALWGSQLVLCVVWELETKCLLQMVKCITYKANTNCSCAHTSNS